MKKILLGLILTAAQAFAQVSVIPNDSLQVGKSTNTTKQIILNKGSGSSNPRIKWNNSTNKIEFSNDGSIFKAIGSGSGGSGGAGVNLLADLNPGAEDGTGSWTNSGGSFTRTTTAVNVLSGTASFVWDAASSGDKVVSSTVTLSNGQYGRACEARVTYIGGDVNNILEVVNNDAEVVGSLQLSAHTFNGPESVFFICPTSTAVGLDADKGILKLQIRQNTGSNAASLTFDDAYLGELSILAEATLPDVFSAKVDGTASPSTVTDENTDWINGNCSRSATGTYVCTFSSGVFTVTPNCWGVSETTGQRVAVTAKSASSVTFENRANDGTGNANSAIQVMCMKQGVDAKQAVQVYKSVPRVAENINEFSAALSSTDVVSDENTDWINGDCTNASTGQFTCNFVAGVFSTTPNCSIQPTATGACDGTRITSVSTSAITGLTMAAGAATNCSHVLSCQKSGTAYKMPIVQPIVSLVPFSRSFTSTNQTITSAGTLSLAHGLGSMPLLVQLRVKCLTAEANYSVGDEIVVDMVGQTASNRGISIVPDSSNIVIRFGSAVNVFQVPDKTTGAGATLTNANWALIVKAWN